jgi:hypothetical protein
LGRFGYQNSGGSPAMTAEALLCLEYLGASYYWYYGTQVMYHMQGNYWNQWNGALSELLLESQVKSGSMAGAWTPQDNWEKSGGRIYATSLRLLMLEVYYRHLPLYQVLRSE